ncbi:MAG: phosphate ABC transporter permease subunit PstC [Beijerinckiaceae bacterium]
MYVWIVLGLLIAAVAAHQLGASSARAVSNATGKHLHSLPNFHGGWVAILTAIPAFLFASLWSLLTPRIEKLLVLGRLGDLSALGPAQIDGLWRDIRALVFGGNPGMRDAMRDQGAALLSNYSAIFTAVLVLGSAALAIGLGLYAYRQIAPEFRARHKVEGVIKIFLIGASVIAVLTTFGIVASLIVESIRFFSMVGPIEFLTGLSWTPQQMAFRSDQAGGTAAFGFVPLLVGTLLITVIAMAVAVPLGLFSAIYLADYASPQIRAIGKPVLEILAGIPTVVYGFFAALTVAPLVRNTGGSVGLDVSSESALAAGLVMGIMIVPFISSLSDDVINAVPQSLRDGSAALGSTKSETIRKVVLPAALPGIVSSVILAVSRAMGETMIVVMAAGLAANLTINPLQAVTTITVQIGTLLTGDQEFDSPKTLAAFGLGLVLFIVTLTLNIIALQVVKKYREQYD